MGEVGAYGQKFVSTGGKLVLIGRGLCQWEEVGAYRQKFVSMGGSWCL
jgi:hypothetical protein